MFILYYKMVINASVYLLIQNKENIHLIQLGAAILIFINNVIWSYG